MSAKKYPARPQIKQEQLENAAFLERLTSIFAISHGSLYLTQKRMPIVSGSVVDTVLTAVVDSSDTPSQYSVLFRATDKKKHKIATKVDASHLTSFVEKYTEICRTGMSSGLKKRDRKKEKKSKK